jgi:hypothetical protein
MCWFCLDIIALKACQAFCSHVEVSFWFEFLLHLFFFCGQIHMGFLCAGFAWILLQAVSDDIQE